MGSPPAGPEAAGKGGPRGSKSGQKGRRQEANAKSADMFSHLPPYRVIPLLEQNVRHKDPHVLTPAPLQGRFHGKTQVKAQGPRRSRHPLPYRVTPLLQGLTITRTSLGVVWPRKLWLDTGAQVAWHAEPCAECCRHVAWAFIGNQQLSAFPVMFKYAYASHFPCAWHTAAGFAQVHDGVHQGAGHAAIIIPCPMLASASPLPPSRRSCHACCDIRRHATAQLSHAHTRMPGQRWCMVL